MTKKHYKNENAAARLHNAELIEIPSVNIDETFQRQHPFYVESDDGCSGVRSSSFSPKDMTVRLRYTFYNELDQAANEALQFMNNLYYEACNGENEELTESVLEMLRAGYLGAEDPNGKPKYFNYVVFNAELISSHYSDESHEFLFKIIPSYVSAVRTGGPVTGIGTQ